MIGRRRASSWPIRAWVVALLLAACSKAGEESQVKRAPVPPPPPLVDVPADLRIPVDVDGGQPAEPITRARLLGLAPDFADSERRAWRLTRVLGDAFAAGTAIEAQGEGGVAITMARPASDADPQPVLFLTRRGDVVAAVVLPDDPFPDYHGSGGRLRRPGDPMPRISPVLRLRIRRDPGARPAR